MSVYGEACRYLGYPTEQVEPAISKKIKSCMERLQNAATPRSVYKIMQCSCREDCIDIEDIQIHSRDLCHHMQGCEKVILFAATLGIEADRLMKRASQLDMAEAVILQACAAALIEDYCNACENAYAEQLRAEGWYLKPRYSPGYGDFSIRFQETMLRVLDCQKRIGLSMTDACMLVPTKSVTACIGLTKQEQGCHIHKCSLCPNVNCPFRKT